MMSYKHKYCVTQLLESILGKEEEEEEEEEEENTFI